MEFCPGTVAVPQLSNGQDLIFGFMMLRGAAVGVKSIYLGRNGNVVQTIWNGQYSMGTSWFIHRTVANPPHATDLKVMQRKMGVAELCSKHPCKVPAVAREFWDGTAIQLMMRICDSNFNGWSSSNVGLYLLDMFKSRLTITGIISLNKR